MLLEQRFLLSPLQVSGLLLLPLPGEGSLGTFERDPPPPPPLAKQLPSFGLGALTKGPGVGMEPQSRQDRRGAGE